jgi:small subunit ribosomal protein S9
LTVEEPPNDEPREEQPEGEQPDEDQPQEEQASEEQPQGEPAEEEQPQGEPAEEEQPQAEESPAEAASDEAASDEAASDEAAQEEAAPEEPAVEEPAAEAAPGEPGESTPGEEPPKRPRRGRKEDEKPKEEVIPGAHLEPDLVLEEERQQAEGEFREFEEPAAEGEEEQPAAAAEDAQAGDEPQARQPLDLAADARYGATGKRKSAVARVILRPGDGTYTVNGRHLDEFFPRIKLQRVARQPLEVAGYSSRMDVVARIHGGGVAAQAGALRHGIARALVEADPNLRLELKSRGYLTRDPRKKERKKAGLKKARKRPQFSKR